MKNIQRKEKGITLIALLITTVILIILAAVAIYSITKVNMIETALDAAQTYEEQQRKEEKEIAGIELAMNPQPNNTNSVYSASEQIVGTWVDNKAIYRQVIDFSEPVASYGSVRYIRKLLIDNVDSIINSGGYFNINNRKIQFGSSETNWQRVPSFHSYAQVEDNKLYVYILYNVSDYSENPITGTVWLEYTKTTD